MHEHASWKCLGAENNFTILTCTWKPVEGSKANSADPDQTPLDVASDQGLQCLLTELSIKNRIKVTNTRHPKMTNELVQNITVEESTCIQLMNILFFCIQEENKNL